MKNAAQISLLALLALAACGGDAPAEDDAVVETPAAEQAATDHRVTIVEPASGAEIMGTSVTVRLAVNGVEIIPAGEIRPGTGHHHLYLDADLGDPTAPVPTVPGSIIHMGDASAAYTFEGVAPGEHRIIAVVADGAHFPLQPWVVDTVTFVVH